MKLFTICYCDVEKRTLPDEHSLAAQQGHQLAALELHPACCRKRLALWPERSAVSPLVSSVDAKSSWDHGGVASESLGKAAEPETQRTKALPGMGFLAMAWALVLAPRASFVLVVMSPRLPDNAAASLLRPATDAD